jgi:hypothetical protein
MLVLGLHDVAVTVDIYGAVTVDRKAAPAKGQTPLWLPVAPNTFCLLSWG